ncbi:DsbA family protein [Agrobacterium tumefaciens]|uniref:DsbA family protein n=1 Tax=Agrobacterium tumefaciens TaxID=358 RepID=UPI0015719B01|nr:DsbA family protein [Agrobacterium tumefaciens]NSY99655.1 DsbA family protein [Agrobacterium tumefaciens]NSZ36408.1 DsbA family protein [Agrobacterium tumefaciens]NTB21924.1 DsbA family protein [Agrobacterium tumefaciens]NTB31730.1 DsbA family protein [Agrobacterium tumefaciens]NTB32211.1 DsbA family protein [Agrobacterium tumefaciens]
MSKTIRLTYLFDPLCGWCYGAAPAIGTLMQQGDITVIALPSGLFAGARAFPMSAGFAAHAWEADQRIAQLTGQTFSENYRKNVLESGVGKVDSGPATLALSAVHLTTPEREFEALTAIQSARYVDGRDNADAAVIADVLTELRLDAAAKRFAVPDTELLKFNNSRIEAAQAEMRRFGASGVPTLIAGEGPDAGIVSSNALYGRTDALIAALCAA